MNSKYNSSNYLYFFPPKIKFIPEQQSISVGRRLFKEVDRRGRYFFVIVFGVFQYMRVSKNNVFHSSTSINACNIHCSCPLPVCCLLLPFSFLIVSCLPSTFMPKTVLSPYCSHAHYSFTYSSLYGFHFAFFDTSPHFSPPRLILFHLWLFIFFRIHM